MQMSKRQIDQSYDSNDKSYSQKELQKDIIPMI